MESELIALDTTCSEAEWLRNLLLDLPIVDKPLPALSVHCDCKAVIDLLKQFQTNKKMTRHIQVRYKSVKALVSANVVSINFVRSEKNLVQII